MSEKEQLSKVIDWLRFPLMVMVVMIHVSLCKEMDYSLPINEMPISAVIWYLLAHGICWAAVPTFFFISGYLFFYDTQNGVNPNRGGVLFKEASQKVLFNFYPIYYCIYHILDMPLWLISYQSISDRRYYSFND